MLEELISRFEAQMPLSMMARLVLQRAFDSQWIDAAFEAHRQRQYSRELLFSTVVDMMSLVSLGLRPSLHAAAKKAPHLPASIAALYEKVNHTEPPVLRALVQGSAQRLAPIVECMNPSSTLASYRLRIVDGNHLPASEKRLKLLRTQRGAALPGHCVVVYDPDLGLVVDLVACPDAYAQERSVLPALMERAEPQDLWIADRNFCTRTLFQGWQEKGACFLVREPAKTHPRIEESGGRVACGRVETGEVFEQSIRVEGESRHWRRIELHLFEPTEAGETTVVVWSNLPETVSGLDILRLYRKRWGIEKMFQRLESALKSELQTMGHPQAALLGFTVAVLAYNVLAVLKRSVEHAHADQGMFEASLYFLALEVKYGYEGMRVALEPAYWEAESRLLPEALARRLLELARRVNPKQVQTHKRGPKKAKPKAYVDGHAARAHFSTARVIEDARKQTP